jgi:hypothetical protein
MKEGWKWCEMLHLNNFGTADHHQIGSMLVLVLLACVVSVLAQDSLVSGVYFADSPSLPASFFLQTLPANLYYLDSDSALSSDSCYSLLKAFMFPDPSNYTQLINQPHTSSVLVLNCAVNGAFPADFANVAYDKGFDAILWVSRWGTVGYAAQSLWRSHSDKLKLPVVDLSKDSFIVSQQPSTFYFDSTSSSAITYQNDITKSSWIAAQSPLFVAYFALCVAKIFDCQDKLRKHAAANFENGHITAATAVLICEILSPILGEC